MKMFRFMFLGFSIGSGIQIPFLIGIHAWFALAVQVILFMVFTPLTIVTFRKK